MPRPSKAKEAAQKRQGASPAYGWGFGSVGTGNDAFIMPPADNFDLLQDMRQMWLTDETCGAMNVFVQTAMRSVPWRFHPQTDGEDDDETKEAIEAAKFANSMLKDMRGTFSDHVQNALAMLWGGFAPCEIILKQRVEGKSKFVDGRYGIDRLPLRDPRTVTGWIYDEEQNLLAMQQTGARNGKPIPIDRILHYRTTTELDTPYGRPMMLPAHRIWRLKRRIQDSEAIGIERDLVGLPMMRVPREVQQQANEKVNGQYTAAALEAQAYITAARQAVSDLRFNKSGGLVLWSNTYNEDEGTHPDDTPKWDFSIVTTGGQRSIDTRTAIRDYDRGMARVGLMQFLHLGDRSTGSFALSDDQSNMGLRSVLGLAWTCADTFNGTALPYVWNINQMDTRFIPQLRPGKISKEDGQKLGALFGGIGRAAGLWETDEEMRAEIARMLELPYDPEAQREAAATAKEKAKNEAKKPTFSAPGAGGDTGGQ